MENMAGLESTSTAVLYVELPEQKHSYLDVACKGWLTHLKVDKIIHKYAANNPSIDRLTYHCQLPANVPHSYSTSKKYTG